MATEFEQKIIDYLRTQAVNGIADTWEIAQAVFPEKWAKRSGRGALIGHIDRVFIRSESITRLPPRDQWGNATGCCRRGAD